MIDHPQFENPRLRELARKLKDIPGVKQIRFWPNIRPDLIEEYGEDSYYFNLVIEILFYPKANFQYL